MELYGLACAMTPKSGASHLLSVVCTPISVADDNLDQFTQLTDPPQMKMTVDTRDPRQLMKAYVDLVKMVETMVQLQRKSCDENGVPYQKLALDIGHDSGNPTYFSALLMQMLGTGFTPVLDEEGLQQEKEKDALCSLRKHTLEEIIKKRSKTPPEDVNMDLLQEAELLKDRYFISYVNFFSDQIEDENDRLKEAMHGAFELRKQFVDALVEPGDAVPEDFKSAVAKTPELLKNCAFRRGQYTPQGIDYNPYHADAMLNRYKPRLPDDPSALRSVMDIAYEYGRQGAMYSTYDPNSFKMGMPPGYLGRSNVAIADQMQALMGYAKSGNVTQGAPEEVLKWMNERLRRPAFELRVKNLLDFIAHPKKLKRVPANTKPEKIVDAINAVLEGSDISMETIQDGTCAQGLIENIVKKFGDSGESLSAFTAAVKKALHESAVSKGATAEEECLFLNHVQSYNEMYIAYPLEAASFNYKSSYIVSMLTACYPEARTNDQIMAAFLADMKEGLGEKYPFDAYKADEWLQASLPRYGFFDWDKDWPGKEGLLKRCYLKGYQEAFKGTKEFQLNELWDYLNSSKVSDEQRQEFVETVNSWLGIELLPPFGQQSAFGMEGKEILQTLVNTRYKFNVTNGVNSKLKADVYDPVGDFLSELKRTWKGDACALDDYVRPAPPYRKVQLPTTPANPYFTDPVHWIIAETFMTLKGHLREVEAESDFVREVGDVITSALPKAACVPVQVSALEKQTTKRA